MDRTSQWVFSQEIPTDVVITVGASEFPLHKFLLVAKSGLIRRKVVESDHPDLGRIDLSAVPGGPETFELAAKFCYGVNFEISARNVAALRCAAEFLEMTDHFSPSNLASRADDFLSRAALKSLPSALQVLRSCDPLLPLADHLHIVHRCVDAIGFKACVEANFPSRSPPEWWAAELAAVGPVFCRKILDAMRDRGASPKKLSTAVAVYIEKSLPGCLVPLAGATVDLTGEEQTRRRGLLESITGTLLPEKDAPLSVGFLCSLLQAAIFLDCSAACRRELEKRISASLDQAAVRDLLTIALDHRCERVADLDSVRRIVAGFVEREMGGGGAFYGGGGACCSVAAQKVARTVDAFVGEVATDEDVPVSKFAGVAGAVPKSCRRFDDDLYRAIDIYLKAHPGLDEIEREKVCSVMDPLKLSYEARLHASQNKRLPLQIVLHALYYDQLKLRSGEAPAGATAVRGQAAADATLMRENEELRSELTRMKMCMTDMQRGRQGSSTSTKAVAAPRKQAFMSSVTKTLGRLNPFGRHGSTKDTTSSSIDMRRRGRAKDTSSIEDDVAPVDVSKPRRRRRFSLS